MKKPKGSATFLQNDDAMLVLAMTGRNFNCRPSQLLQIEDELVAWDFDTAATMRLFRQDNEREAEDKRWWAKLLVKLATGNDLDD